MSKDHDTESLFAAILRYRNTFEELIHLRRKETRMQALERRLSARLSRIKRRYFEQDGSHHLADILRRGVLKDLKKESKKRKKCRRGR